MSLDINAFCTKSDSSRDVGHYCAKSQVLSIFAVQSCISIHYNKVSLTLKIILTSQENFDVKYRRNKKQQMDANETASYCCFGYSIDTKVQSF